MKERDEHRTDPVAEVGKKQLTALKRTALSWQKRLAETHGRNVIGVASKARRAIAVYNGFQACLKEAIPTLHEEVLGTDESKHAMGLVEVPQLKGGKKKKKKEKDRRRLLWDR